jgi:hypothetical protein
VPYTAALATPARCTEEHLIMKQQLRALSLGLLAVAASTTALSAVPVPPINLTAVVSGSTITLSWSFPTRTVLLGYILEAGTAPGASNIASSPVGLRTTFTATSVPPGRYYVRVRALAEDGESAPSNEVIITVGAGGTVCVSAPNPPFALAGFASGSSVSFRWGSSGGCPVSNYVLLAGSAPGASNVAIVNLGLMNEISATAPPGTYYVRVIAQNANGTSAPSNEVVLTVGSATPTPPRVPGSGK